MSKGKYSYLRALLLPFLLLCMWGLLTHSGIIEGYILPSPFAVIQACVTDFGNLFPHVLFTAAAAVIGICFALLFASVCVFLMGAFPLVYSMLYPVLVVSQTIPLFALAPLFILWFGFGIIPKILVVTLVCFFPIAVNLMEGITSIDTDIIHLLLSMGARRIQLFSKAYIPASMSHLFAGLRVAATYSVLGSVIGEWLGGTQGIGVYMIRAQKSFALDKVFAAILMVVVLSFAVLGGIIMLQRLFMPVSRRALV